MLEQPSRLARLAAEHLDLRPARPTQLMTIADLPLRADLGTESRNLRAVLPSGAEVELRLKPALRPSPIAAMAQGLRDEP